MSLVTRCLTDGGIPDGWTIQNLDWLAQAHRRFSEGKARNNERASWHGRWAALITDILETHRGQNH